eukprot:5230980-Heterocapsa_arctica.AAC.1
MSAGCLVPGCAGAVLRPQPGRRRPGYHGEDVVPPGVTALCVAGSCQRGGRACSCGDRRLP